MFCAKDVPTMISVAPAITASMKIINVNIPDSKIETINMEAKRLQTPEIMASLQYAVQIFVPYKMEANGADLLTVADRGSYDRLAISINDPANRNGAMAVPIM